ncbi:MAG TPA: EamA family transporter [Candidatus Acidoferrum sp.]|nr:EamA family transporter [Candidatus Acidoferrum sp.]
MSPHRNLHLKTFALIFFMVIFGPVGDVLLSKGMREVGALSSWAPAAMFDFFFRAFTTGMVWAGILSLLAFFLCYTLVLSWADYSFVQPASSFAYAVVALLGHFALHETVSPLRWFGIAIICVGVLIVGHTPPRTTEVHSLQTSDLLAAGGRSSATVVANSGVPAQNMEQA